MAKLSTGVTPIDQVKTLIIPANDDISDTLDCGGLRIVAIQFNSDWVDAATIQVAASTDGGTYQAAVYVDIDGTKIPLQLTVPADGGAYENYSAQMFYGIRYVQFYAPIPVEYERRINVVVRPL
jgi:hypothetical protein